MPCMPICKTAQPSACTYKYRQEVDACVHPDPCVDEMMTAIYIEIHVPSHIHEHMCFMHTHICTSQCILSKTKKRVYIIIFTCMNMHNACMHAFICMYVSVYVMRVCNVMYVCMYVCNVCMHACMHAMHVCMYACMYVCMYACNVCMYV